MRKIFLAGLIYILTAANIASAAMLNVSDDNVQNFIHSIADTIYTDKFQKEMPLLLTNAAKIENAELPEIGSVVWACQYGLKTSAQPDGEILFFVNGEEKVTALKVVGYTEQSIQSAVELLIVALEKAGLTRADAEFLLNNLKDDEVLASSIVWSESKKRCFLLMAGGRPQAAEGFQFTVMASDKKN